MLVKCLNLSIFLEQIIVTPTSSKRHYCDNHIQDFKNQAQHHFKCNHCIHYSKIRFNKHIIE